MGLRLKTTEHFIPKQVVVGSIPITRSTSRLCARMPLPGDAGTYPPVLPVFDLGGPGVPGAGLSAERSPDSSCL